MDQLLGGTPIANGRLLVRQKDKLVCFDLRPLN